MSGQKRKAGASDSSANAELLNIALSNYRRVTVSKWKGTTLVDIRETYEDKATGETRPGKKGISLTSEQFKVLASNVAAIQAALDGAAPPPAKAAKTSVAAASSSDAATKETESESEAADAAGSGDGGEAAEGE